MSSHPAVGHRSDPAYAGKQDHATEHGVAAATGHQRPRDGGLTSCCLVAVLPPRRLTYLLLGEPERGEVGRPPRDDVEVACVPGKPPGEARTEPAVPVVYQRCHVTSVAPTGIESPVGRSS